MRNNYFQTILVFLIISINCLAQDFPEGRAAVNDFANVISSEYVYRITSICETVLQKTGAAIVVVTIPTLGDNVIEDYAVRLFEQWGIGKKGEDRGILILNAIEDRKVRIEVGYGLEGIIPDGLAGEIRDRYLIPYLKQGEYGAAYLAAVQAIAGIIAEDAGVDIDGVAAPVSAQSERGGRWVGKIIMLLILFLIFPAASAVV